ncbi:MAG: DUF456 domain-containing protein [Flavobacteriales bacterium]
MAEIAILLIGLLINGIGILGCIIPALPGPAISWCSLLLFYFLPEYEISTTALVVSGILMLLVTGLDYVVPVLGAKKFGSSRAGVIGGMIGVVVGLIFSLTGVGVIFIVLGPLIGTIVGDLAAGGTFTKALNSGLGSLIGFLIGTSIKLFYSIAVLILFTVTVGGALIEAVGQWLG